MSFWTFNPASRRYRITPEGAAATGQRPGTFIGQARMLRFREDMITHGKERTNALAGQVATGNITLNQWVLGMRQEVKNNFINQYMLAHGGRNTMTQAKWGELGAIIKTQYRYLDSFAQDIASGKYTEQAVAARARMYVESSSQAFERGKAAQRGVPDLPQYPGDGSTQCLGNCKCSWRIDEDEQSFLCYWQLSASEHCSGCLTNAEQWNPLIMPKSLVATRSAVVEHLEVLAHA